MKLHWLPVDSDQNIQEDTLPVARSIQEGTANIEEDIALAYKDIPHSEPHLDFDSTQDDSNPQEDIALQAVEDILEEDIVVDAEKEKVLSEQEGLHCNEDMPVEAGWAGAYIEDEEEAALGDILEDDKKFADVANIEEELYWVEELFEDQIEEQLEYFEEVFTEEKFVESPVAVVVLVVPGEVVEVFAAEVEDQAALFAVELQLIVDLADFADFVVSVVQ